MLIASHVSVLAMMLTEAIIVYGREDKRRNLKIVRSKEFRPNFPVAEQNVGRIWPQPKCSKVGKVHQPPAGRSGVRGLRCVLHCATLCYTVSYTMLHSVLFCIQLYPTMLHYAAKGCSSILQAQALAQKWLKLENNVFIAHTLLLHLCRKKSAR